MTPSEAGMKRLMDVNCWALLFYGYEGISDKRIGYEIVKDIGENVYDVDKDKFSENVKKLFTFFHFDLKSFYEVWRYQHNIQRLLHQIVRKPYFIGNRFAMKKYRMWSPKVQLVCYPSKHERIPLPKMHRILDGLLFPVILSKNNKEYRIERLETTNFGEGDFLTCNHEIIDCIRINNFWQTRNHLKQRLSFSFLVETDYEEAPMIVCNNFKDMEVAWDMLGADERNGVLIRSLGEDLYQNYWILLNKESAFPAMYTKDGYCLSCAFKKKEYGFVTLEGRHVGLMGHRQDVLPKMKWMDEFDIERWRRVVFR